MLDMVPGISGLEFRNAHGFNPENFNFHISNENP